VTLIGGSQQFSYFSVIMANLKNNAQSANGQKPNLPKRLFWDWRYDAIDWQNLYPKYNSKSNRAWHK
jgi:hypothetical protein